MNRNTTQNTAVVMDVLPWPNGLGFNGRDEWWQHTLDQSERDRLDNLLGLALLDKNICEQLVVKRDTSLLAAFGFSEETQHWLTRIHASTLKEFAQAVLAAFNPYSDGAASEAA